MFTFLKINKLRLFDILVIFMVCCIGIFSFIVLFRKTSQINVVLRVDEDGFITQSKIGGTSIWFTELFKPGMKEISVSGQTMAKVIGVRNYYVSNNISTIPKIVLNDRKEIYLTVALKTVYSNSNNLHAYKGKDILIGSTLQMSLDNILVKGLIVDIEGSKKNNIKKLSVQAQIISIDPIFPQTEGVPDYIAKNVIEGEIMKDSLGQDIVKITKKIVEDAKVAVITSSGEVIMQKHPMRKDVYLDLEILAEKVGDRYYLYGNTNFPVLVGSFLPFYTNKSSIFLTITKINGI